MSALDSETHITPKEPISRSRYLIPTGECLASICGFELGSGNVVSLASIILERASVESVHALVQNTLEDDVQHCGRSRLEFVGKHQRRCLVVLVERNVRRILAIYWRNNNSNAQTYGESGIDP